MTIPVYLTNRDLFNSPREMVSYLREYDEVGQITIVDCGSTYPETLAWYDMLEFDRIQTGKGVRVVREANRGPRCVWDADLIDRKSDFYVVSDADLDLSGVPFDCLTKLRDTLAIRPKCIKAGLSLRIDDLSESSPVRDSVIERERGFWEDFDGTVFNADIDTTFAIYRKNSSWGGYGPAVRLPAPYTARHIAWYLSRNNVPKDWEWYFRHLSTNGILWSAILAQKFGEES